jgi:tetratricopeptide (TPR) repeat protein
MGDHRPPEGVDLVRITLQDRTVDLDNGEISTGGRLTQFECTVVRHLRERSGEVLSRDTLLVDVWGYPKPVPTRCVDTAMRRIRFKLEINAKSPKHLLTIQGEGYRWTDQGLSPDPVRDRCGGRAAWSDQLLWAETTFGRSFSPHDPEVGLHREIAKAFHEERSALPDGPARCLALLCMTERGWTPDELAAHGAAADVRPVVAGGWAVVEHNRVRLADLWWPVRVADPSCRTAVAAIWLDRLAVEGEVDLLELQDAFAWPELDAASRVQLLRASTARFHREGLARHHLLACDGVLAEAQAPDLMCQVLLTRCVALRSMGLTEAALADAESAFALAEAHRLPTLGRAAGAVGVVAQNLGLWDQAIASLSRAVELERDTQPHFCCGHLALLATLHMTLGDLDTALRVARDGCDLARRHNLEERQWRTSRALASILLGQGRHAEAVARLQGLFAAQEQPEALVVIALDLGAAMLDLGKLDEAEAWIRRSADSASRIGDEGRMAQVDHAWGTLAAIRGNWNGASRHFLGAISRFEDAGLDNHSVIPLCWCAVARHRMGDTPGALAMLNTVEALLTPGTTPGVLAVRALATASLDGAGVDVSQTAGILVFVRIAQHAFEASPS